jgi:hypothetical protein
MRLFVAAVILFPQAALAQSADDLQAQIEDHYAAIHTGDLEAVADHHLPEISVFPPTGHMLMESGWEAADARMGAATPFPETAVVMRHFSAQLYDDVGVATFYLDGVHDGERGTWRVSAVWVWRNGSWLESHHHESRLVS